VCCSWLFPGKRLQILIGGIISPSLLPPGRIWRQPDVEIQCISIATKLSLLPTPVGLQLSVVHRRMIEHGTRFATFLQ
jgi:hypothetical protein